MATRQIYVPLREVILTGMNSNVFAVDDAAAGTSSPLPVGGIYRATLPTYTDLDRTQWQADSSGNLRARWAASSVASADGVTLNLGLPLGSGSQTVNLLPASATHIFNGTSFDRLKKPASNSRIPSAAATTNATSAKATAGDVTSVHAYNTTAGVLYLKLYNKASAPTVGTDTPTHTLAIPPNGALNIVWPHPLYFSTGIAYALTGGAADADATALALGAVVALTITYN